MYTVVQWARNVQTNNLPLKTTPSMHMYVVHMAEWEDTLSVAVALQAETQ